MPFDPLFLKFALLLGLSLFFGLAFEEFHARAGLQRPGGIRTFPMLAMSGGVLYLLDPDRKWPLVSGLLILGAWLLISYRRQLHDRTRDNQYNVELVAPICNALAYLIGPASLALPFWVAIAVTVIAVLLLTTREALHAIAQRVEMREIITAAEFLILTGIVLPLLPDEPVTTLTPITPFKAWLALLAVCTLSYGSYLLQRLFAAAASDLVVAALGGLYSSTATTVIFARAARAEAGTRAAAQAGIILATAIMYLRLLIVVAIFDLPLAGKLAPVLLSLCLAGLALTALRYRGAASKSTAAQTTPPRNPLELTAAAIFAVLFVVISVATQWARSHFGAPGVELLAAVVGFTDIDPFVLGIAQSGTSTIATETAAIAIVIATSSNNILKAIYAMSFAGWRAAAPAAAALVVLAAAGAVAAWFI